MANKRKIGTSNPFPNPSRRFSESAMSNNIGRQRWVPNSEVRAALEFFRWLKSNDAEYFLKHKVNRDGSLQHLFWCNRRSRFDYKQFGDVVALETTFVKSKYTYPVVVFSGVNHHINTAVFATAIITDETEDTYVWLFQQFKVAMGSKSPALLITKDDMALKNAMGRVFPNAHHRLCAQQILGNVSREVSDPMITAQFKDLMLSDYAVSEFNSKWDEMVAHFGLEDRSWVTDMYEKRKMWATAYFRGRCFVGFKATSRCAGFNVVGFGRVALVNYVQQLHTSLDDLQKMERKADFLSANGVPGLRTMFKALERSAARVYTTEVFMLFRPAIARVGTMKVVYYCNDVHSSASIYKVSKFGKPDREWSVHYYPPHCNPPTYQLVCDCQRMENYGIPCDHIVHVMLYLDIAEMPTSLVLKRWAKSPKKIVKGTCDEGGFIWDSTSIAEGEAFLDLSTYDFSDTIQKVRHQIDTYDYEDESGASPKDDDEINFSDFDWNVKFASDSDESDTNDGPSFKRRAQNDVDDEW